MTDPKFVKRKRPNNKRLIILLIVLIGFILIYFYLDEILAAFN